MYFVASRKNKMKETYQPFLGHISSCKTCDTLKDSMCDNGKEIFQKARMEIVEYLERNPETETKAVTGVRFQGESKPQPDSYLTNQKKIRKAYTAARAELLQAKERLEKVKVFFERDSEQHSDISQLISSIEEAIFYAEEAKKGHTEYVDKALNDRADAIVETTATTVTKTEVNDQDVNDYWEHYIG